MVSANEDDDDDEGWGGSGSDSPSLARANGDGEHGNKFAVASIALCPLIDSTGKVLGVLAAANKGAGASATSTGSS